MKLRYWIAGAALGAAAFSIVRRTATRRPRKTPRHYRVSLNPIAEAAGPDEGSVLFIGTATTLIRYRGLTVLTDPNFLHRGEKVHIGYGMHSTRLTNPALNWEDLPAVDFVLLSHLHEDHFDKFVERELVRHMPIVTTAEGARVLARRGFTRTVAMRPWDEVNMDKGDVSLRITAMPGTHGPLLMAAALPAVIGSMLEFRNRTTGSTYRMYISGDTLVHEDLREIPRRYPDIDLALLHLGGTRVLGVLVTMNAQQGIEALRIVDPRLVIPIHYNDYDVFKEPLEAFEQAVVRAGLQDKVRYLLHGEIYSFSPATQQASL
jgi:L-ascorbate metabolism protein UlaG (beta-lactamase superfamily)